MTCHLPKFCPLSFDHRAILLMLLLNYSGITHGYPEFSGDGYFSCTSCHVSASGGDLVTAYGRSFSEEKIAAFHFVGEAQPFHGQATLPEWLLVGGHLRELQLNYEDERVKEGRHFRMQQEIDLGVNVKNIWTYATVSAERKEQNPYEFQPNRPLISKWIFRYDPLEAVSLRVGRIYPKFGLNVPDHNAFVRQNLDLGAGKERPLAEISYFSELAEVNLSHSAGFLPNTKLDEPEKNFPASQEIYLNISTFWYESQRISVSAVERKRGEALSRFVSGSAVITPLLGKDKTFRILLEHQYGLEVDKGMKSRMTICMSARIDSEGSKKLSLTALLLELRSILGRT
ncbi:MAG: hypothetical protein NTV34_15530 [Proteobacteria bacterium]|nr:hypothetical protein [Pseudomonadota bacterium]